MTKDEIQKALMESLRHVVGRKNTEEIRDEIEGIANSVLFDAMMGKSSAIRFKSVKEPPSPSKIVEMFDEQNPYKKVGVRPIKYHHHVVFSQEDINRVRESWENEAKVDSDIPVVFVSPGHTPDNVVADVYPEEVLVLFMTLGQYQALHGGDRHMMLIEWTSINPTVVRSLVKADVPIARRPRNRGYDYELALEYESLLRLHMAAAGQKMRCVRAQRNQYNFIRRHT